MENSLKDKFEKWKHVIAFLAFGVGACLISSGVTIWVYRDVIQQQTFTHQEQVKTLNEQLVLERGETRKMLGDVIEKLDLFGVQIQAISESVREIALVATRMTGEAAEAAKNAAGTAKSAAATAKRAATSVREAVKELNEPPAAPPRKRRAPKEFIEP